MKSAKPVKLRKARFQIVDSFDLAVNACIDTPLPFTSCYSGVHSCLCRCLYVLRHWVLQPPPGGLTMPRSQSMGRALALEVA